MGGASLILVQGGLDVLQTTKPPFPEHVNSGQLRPRSHKIVCFVRYVHGTQNAFLG